jgi:hypothetical protein
MFRREYIETAPAFRDLLREHGLTSVEAVYRLASGSAITQSGTTEVRRVVLSSAAGEQIVFIKKYWITHPRQLWSGMLRGNFLGCPKVRREYLNLEWLRATGLDAPAPVAFGEERRRGWLIRSYLISAGVPEPLPLHEYIRDRLPLLPPDRQKPVRQSLITRLADYTRHLHEHRFVHHDYFWRNILLSRESREHFYLIDAHKGRTWQPWNDQASRSADLAALDAPAPHFFRRSERLRFFLHYLGQPRLNAAAKKLLLRTLAKAEPMRERQLRRVFGKGRTVSPVPSEK